MSRARLPVEQRCQLERQLQRASVSRVYRRILAVLEYDRGRAVDEIAGSLGVSRRSVYNWIDAYWRSYDPRVLFDEARPGRPRRWSEHEQALLRSLLGTSPERLGNLGANWTVPLLQDQVRRATGVLFSDETVRRALRAEEYVWKRPRYVLEPDPEREKKRRIRRIVRKLAVETALLAEDETDLLLFPPLRAGWAKAGEPAQVWLSGWNARRVIFGAMDLRTGFGPAGAFCVRANMAAARTSKSCSKRCAISTATDRLCCCWMRTQATPLKARSRWQSDWTSNSSGCPSGRRSSIRWICFGVIPRIQFLPTGSSTR